MRNFLRLLRDFFRLSLKVLWPFSLAHSPLWLHVLSRMWRWWAPCLPTQFLLSLLWPLMQRYATSYFSRITWCPGHSFPSSQQSPEITTMLLLLTSSSAFGGGDNGSASFSWMPSRLFWAAAMETKHRYRFHLPSLAIKRQARNVSPTCSANQPGTYPFLKILIEGNSCKFVGKPSASGTKHRLDN